MFIKIYTTDGDQIATKINGTIKDIALHYFPRKEIEKIEILEGGTIYENDIFINIATELYRPTAEEIENFQLFHNVRYKYLTLHKDDKTITESSAGLCSVG